MTPSAALPGRAELKDACCIDHVAIERPRHQPDRDLWAAPFATAPARVRQG